MKIFGYIDETSFKDDFGNQFSGTGMFICKEPLNSNLTQKAINKLENSEARNDRNKKKELEVISNGLFHATKDTYNTRLSFIETLNENVNGHFKFSIFKEKKSDKTQRLQNKAMELCVLLASYDFYDISILIEESNRLSNESLKQWELDLYLRLERSIYKTPTIPLFFPKIDFKFVKKKENNFGLQTIDYLLWAYQRSVNASKDNSWLNLLNLKMESNSHDEYKEVFDGNYSLNNPILKSKLYYPNKVNTAKIDEDIRISFSRMENLILQINSTNVNKRVKHFSKSLETTRKMIHCKSRVNDEYVIKIASTFIRIFDNYPIYKDFDNDIENWNLALYTRKIASLLIQPRNQIHINRSINAIIRFKNNG